MARGKPHSELLDSVSVYHCLTCLAEVPDPTLHLNNSANRDHKLFELRSQVLRWKS